MSNNFQRAGIVLCIIAGACTLTPTPTPGLPKPNAQETVDAFAALTSGLEIPPQFEFDWQGEAVRTGDEFDVNEYFSVLNHLSMEPGYVLDYVYYGELMGGKPYLYAREASSPRYSTAFEYYDAVGGSQSFYEFLGQLEDDYLDHVQTDGTAEGFFQLTVLQTMGGQFYLFWHAEYDDATVVCNRAGLEAVLAEANQFGSPVPAEVREEAQQLDLEPQVQFMDDSAIVRVVVFTKWGGFIEVRYTFSRSFPHRLLGMESETLVPYDCGVMF